MSEPDFDKIARHILRPIRGCATDDQYIDAMERADKALREAYVLGQVNQRDKCQCGLPGNGLPYSVREDSQ